MNPALLLAELKAEGGTLELRDGRLAVRMSGASQGNRLAERLRAHKDALYGYLEALGDCEKSGDYPLSQTQELVWSAFRTDPANIDYCDVAAIQVPEVSPERLDGIVRHLADLHPSLRARISLDAKGIPKQRYDASPPRIEVFRSADWNAAQVRETLRSEARSPFDLVTGPCWRVLLFLDSGPDCRIGFITSHLIFDMAAYYILMNAVVDAIGSAAIQSMEAPPLTYGELALGEAFDPVTPDALAYWKGTLSGSIRPIAFAASDERSGAASSIKRLEWSLGREATHSLKSLAKNRKTTPYRLLLATLQVILARIAGHADFLVGVPTTNREAEAAKVLVGDFVNVIPLKCSVDKSADLAAILEDVSAQLTGAAIHKASMASLVDAIDLLRQEPGQPLVQVSFSWNHSRSAKQLHTIDGAPVDEIMPPEQMGAFTDLVMTAHDQRDDIHFTMAHKSSDVRGNLLGDLKQRWVSLINTLVQSPDAVCLTLAVTPEDVQKSRLALPLPPAATLRSPCAWIDAIAAENGQRTAIKCRTGSLTFLELHDRTVALATAFFRLGFRRGDRIAICLRRDENLVLVLVALMRLGAVYVPLDRSFPAARVDEILSIARPKALLVNQSEISDFSSASVDVYAIDDLPLHADERTEFGPALDLECPAYVIFTSGSTGKPKGVEVPLRGVAALIEWARATYSADDLAGVLFATPVIFDISVFEIFCTLSLGGTLVVSENVIELASDPLWDQVTLINTTPTNIEEVLLCGRDPAALRIVNLAGEVLTLRLLRKIRRTFPMVRVLNLYGPSEDTCYSVGCDVTDTEKKPLIGMPICGSRADILDELGSPVIAHGVGELWMSGFGVALGYVGEPGLTADSFQPRDDLPKGSLAYRTGDLVRHVPSGGLEFVGRKGRQIKWRGVRIEPAEIEAVLAAHESVLRCAVDLRKGGDGPNGLFAFVEWLPGADQTPGELERYLRERLPRGQIPQQIVPTNSWPLGPTGKLDVRRLKVAVADQATDTEFSERESAVADIWEEVLSRRPISVDDDFFEAGGHSLKATLLVSKLSARFGTTLSPGTILEERTIRRIAAYLPTGKDQAD